MRDTRLPASSLPRPQTLAAASDFAASMLDGLLAKPKRMACKFFYDREGSALFERICTLPEYYQTRTELRLLADYADEIAMLMGEGIELIEFGAGALAKVSLLLDELKSPHLYMPIDISGEYLRSVAAKFEGDYPDLSVQPIVADFTKPLVLPAKAEGRRRVGFFPGSTIGNLDPLEALQFLKNTAASLRGGGLLVGVDLIKDPAVLHAAYNDAEGVTAAFNKNLLARANRELGADFDLNGFAHYAFYNPVEQRIEMYLVSLQHQSVDIAGTTIGIANGEAIHTENSYKYTVEGFVKLASRAGFIPRAAWCDAGNLFSLHWLETL
ncbi:MAG: L-histidine N(alpha)-methyltransferase [Beijerinckiaceae bacterium]